MFSRSPCLFVNYVKWSGANFANAAKPKARKMQNMQTNANGNLKEHCESDDNRIKVSLPSKPFARDIFSHTGLESIAKGGGGGRLGQTVLEIPTTPLFYMTKKGAKAR